MRSFGLILLSLLSVSCVTDPEKIPFAPLPTDGTALTYGEVLSRLSAQTNTARDEHFLNHWDTLSEVAQGLEQSAGYLLKSTNVPARRQAALAQDTTELLQNIRQLQTTAKVKDETQSLEAIRRIHNRVRELRTP